ncbi:MAG: hypothetical protein OXQ89_10655, partial [Rhodospirillaceae bacterium]|nr:hypothetical protein [Rhodospirillaceae bacterium]
MFSTNETAASASAELGTLYVAIKISEKSWVVGIASPTGECIGPGALGSADVEGLQDLIKRQRSRAERAVGDEVRVVCCYEADYEGFWPARWLEQEMSIETVVLDTAVLLVNGKAKQRKTERIAAKKMVRALLAHAAGRRASRRHVLPPSVT